MKNVEKIGSIRTSAMTGFGVRVEPHTTAAGNFVLESIGDHRVKMQVAESISGSCEHGAFRYGRGDLDVLPAGYSDVWREDSHNTAIFVQVSPLLLQRAAEENGFDPRRSGLEVRCQFRDQRLEHIVWALAAEHTAGYENGSLFAESLGLALAVHLLGRYPTPVRLRRSVPAQRMERLKAYIDANLDQDLSLSTLAGVAGLSASHFKAVFRHSAGLPVHQYVVQRRVARARSLLLGTDLPAIQIALEAGFAHQSHMARCMRQILGVTPSALTRRAISIGEGISRGASLDRKAHG